MKGICFLFNENGIKPIIKLANNTDIKLPTIRNYIYIYMYVHTQYMYLSLYIYIYIYIYIHMNIYRVHILIIMISIICIGRPCPHGHLQPRRDPGGQGGRSRIVKDSSLGVE